MEEKLAFLDNLPFRLRMLTIMAMYKDYYENVIFLKAQPPNFLGWICPLLRQEIVPAEQYLYYETDPVTDIYFSFKGIIGFVLPFKENIIYIEIHKGDVFGEIDLSAAASIHGLSVLNMIETMNSESYHMNRQFTVQAIENSEMLSLSMANLQRMSKQFQREFQDLF